MFEKYELISKTLKERNFVLEHFPEIPLVGRSNVGKSTFFNKILKRKIAKVSKTPGRTRSIDFYLIDSSFYLVDLPGFGYAKVGKSLKEKWEIVMKSYFQRQSITYVIHLIDSSIPVQKIDIEVSNWLKSLGLKEILLFTKIDKIKKSKKFSQINKLKKSFDIYDENLVFNFSKNFSEDQILDLQEKFYGLFCP